jgi:hypothetical protein
MARLRRPRRRWLIVLGILLLVLVYAAWPGRWTFTVSPETTYITGPLDAEGYVDYPTALNERLREGVTPETNANVLIVRALGPRPEGAELAPEFYRWLGIDRPPDEGDSLVSWDKYFQAHLKDLPIEEEPPGWFDELFRDEFDELPAPPDPRRHWDDRMSRAREWPWKAKDEPEIADWLRRNEKPLALMIEATRRPHYFNPLVSANTAPQSARLLNSLVPTVQKCREVVNALCCRAMRRIGEGDVDGAWQDLLACQRLGRLLSSKGSLIETLAGIAMSHMACSAELTLLSHGKASIKQVRGWLDDLRKLPPMTSVPDKVGESERFLLLDALMSIVCHGPEYLSKMDVPGGTKPAKNQLPGRLFSRSVDFDPAFRNINQTIDRWVAAGRLPDRQSRRAEYDLLIREVKQLKADVTGMGAVERALTGKTSRGKYIGNAVIALILPAYDKIHDAADRLEQVERNLHLAFALALYRADRGRYPAHQAELAPKYLPAVPGDLFSGGPLVYRPEGDGYLLYSVGINGLDEDGRRREDDPPGDDLRVRIPVPEPKPKVKPKADAGRRLEID